MCAQINYSRQNQKFSKSMMVLLQRMFFQELSDPAFRRISINHLQINPKKTLATVYLDIENAGPNSNIILKLNSLNSFLRRKLADELSVYKVPYLNFVDDKTFKQALKVEKLINDSCHD